MFTIARGSTRNFTVTVRDEEDELVDLTGAKIYWTARDGSDVVVLTKLNTAAGGGDAQIEVTALGTFKIKVIHADTTSREPMVGSCDGWVVTAGGEYLQVIAPQPFQITQAHTRAIP